MEIFKMTRTTKQTVAKHTYLGNQNKLKNDYNIRNFDTKMCPQVK